MDNCAIGYASHIMELLEAAKQKSSDPMIFIEQRLDYSKFVKDGFSTGDCVIIADGTLYIIDYKHGKGVLVEAKQNPKMMLYALGACEHTISMTIYQPRRENISTYTISKDELYQWANEILVPTATLAFSGEGNYQCGEWCQFCKTKHECRARADYNLQLARYEFKLPPLLEDDEIESIFTEVDEFIAWASDICDYALQTAISGKHWNGWKLVEGRSNRRYTK